MRMNWDIIEGQWKQFKGRARQAWSKLTDDDLANLNGKRATTNATSSIPLEAAARGVVGNVDVIRREPRTAAIAGGRSP
jgi:uncharacterized protein YjbJ (UPF0337 family)